ncbi:hypothetical protein ACVRXQ_06040 [Streptococcus panodentis]|uniref:Uncharacterized protein n=1 Tax=Streptococcus panodentis TaxID=1581472 RepID=A0ABS5AUU5_9STRE|nr:hypothetical protein [Streptococcus panodentis]MBP2620337.1 hypothetical protein [Streptococcus panodentis]
MKKVECITEDSMAVVDRERLFVRVVGKAEMVFASQYFPTYRGSYRLLQIPVFEPKGRPRFLRDCEIDWDRMPEGVTALVETFKQRREDDKS